MSRRVGVGDLAAGAVAGAALGLAGAALAVFGYFAVACGSPFDAPLVVLLYAIEYGPTYGLAVGVIGLLAGIAAAAIVRSSERGARAIGALVAVAILLVVSPIASAAFAVARGAHERCGISTSVL